MNDYKMRVTLKFPFFSSNPQFVDAYPNCFSIAPFFSCFISYYILYLHFFFALIWFIYIL